MDDMGNKFSQSFSVDEILKKQESLIERHESIIQTTLRIVDDKKRNNLL